MTKLRSWLKEKRTNRKLTQDQVAKMCDISRSFYTHVENGTKTPSVAVAKRIAGSLSFKWTIFFENDSSLGELDKANSA